MTNSDEPTPVQDYPTRDAARRALSGAMGQAANRFFRKATSAAVDFRITRYHVGQFRLEFWVVSRNAGYRKG